MKLAFEGRGWIYALVLSVAVLLIFSPIIFSETHPQAGKVTSDYPAIIEFAERIQQGTGDVPAMRRSHPVWELLIIAVNEVLGVSMRNAAFLVTLGSELAAALILYFWMAPILRARNLSRWWAVIAAIGLNLVAPLSLLAPVDGKYYLGYIGIVSYHNPTIILLRPLALLQFIYAIRVLQKTDSRWGDWAIAAAVTLLATFAKPSFAICLLPALGLLAAYRWLKKQTVDWRLLLLGFFLPSLLMLGWQFLLTYGSSAESGIIFLPFGVMSAYSDNLLVKFLLAVVFPLLIVLLFPGALRDPRMILGWLAFLVGVFFTYFLAEGEPRTLDGNFAWSGEITLLILFCISTLFLLERAGSSFWKITGARLAWLSHVAFGLIYYWHVFTTQKYA